MGHIQGCSTYSPSNFQTEKRLLGFRATVPVDGSCFERLMNKKTLLVTYGMVVSQVLGLAHSQSPRSPRCTCTQPLPMGYRKGVMVETEWKRQQYYRLNSAFLPDLLEFSTCICLEVWRCLSDVFVSHMS